jgi:hypothetical protein
MNQCEACLREGDFKHPVTITSPRMTIDIKHFKMALNGQITASELIYIHNCRVAGINKPLMK